MSTYCYEAINFSGETISGEMEATTSNDVVEQLHRLGYVALAADQKAGHRSSSLNLKRLGFSRDNKFQLNDIAFFTQELSVMLHAGLPLEKALSVLASLSERPKMIAFVDDLLTRVRGGNSLAEALKAQKFELPKGYIGMIRAGEAGGARVLEGTLGRIAEHLKQVQKVRENIFSAMLYPSIVLSMAGLSIILILFFVLPQFEPFFQNAPAALPLSAKIVIGIAHVLQNYWLFFLISIFAFVFTARKILQKETVKLKHDELFLKLPKLGSIIAKAEMAKFCNTLGVLLTNGVTLVSGLAIAAETFGNQQFSSAAHRVMTNVREGGTLSTQMQRESIFPPLSIQMMKIGEETGQLAPMLLKVADIYDRSVQRSIERLMALLMPLTTIVLGIIIAAIIAAVLTAILSVNDVVT